MCKYIHVAPCVHCVHRCSINGAQCSLFGKNKEEIKRVTIGSHNLLILFLFIFYTLLTINICLKTVYPFCICIVAHRINKCTCHFRRALDLVHFPIASSASCNVRMNIHCSKKNKSKGKTQTTKNKDEENVKRKIIFLFQVEKRVNTIYNFTWNWNRGLYFVVSLALVVMDENKQINPHMYYYVAFSGRLFLSIAMFYLAFSIATETIGQHISSLPAAFHFI